MEFKDYNNPFEDYNGGGVLFFFFLFSLKKKTMVSPLVLPKDADDIGTYYVSDEQILFFQIEVKVLSYKDKGMVILEACSPTKRVTITVSYDYPFTYFYLYLLFIKDIGIILPFSPLFMEVLKVLNVVPFQLLPNNWDFIRVVEMVYEELEISHIVWVFLILYYQAFNRRLGVFKRSAG